MKIAYLGYDVLFPCLEALEEAGCSVMEVFTCRTDDQFEFHREVLAFAKQRGLCCHVQPITLEDIHRLRDAGCQAIFCAGYFYKVPIDHSVPIVNVHPAMLPKGRGAWPMPVTILRQLPESGVTLHKMEQALDAGDILIQQAFPVGPREDLESMTRTICRIAALLCRQVAGDFEHYWNHATPQGEFEYWPYPGKADATITQATSARQADRILRAFFGFDCYLAAPDREICVIRGKFRPQEHDLPFGTAVECADGATAYAVTGGVVVAEQSEVVPL